MVNNTKWAKRSLELTYPKEPPFKNVREYLLSKKSFEDARHFHSYQWDKPGHQPIFHLVAGQRILEDTTRQLEEKREWAKRERVKLQSQWDDLYDKQLKFKETFQTLSSFVKSNQDKRLRAQNSLNEDYKLRMKRTQEIETLQKLINVVVESKKEMEANIAELKMYELYLNQVVSASEDFKNADDLISRYESLVSTRNLLAKRQDENLKELETARAKIAKMVEDNSFKILGLNTALASLNSRYNTAFREAVHWENIVLAIKSHSFQRFQELAEVKQSCWNTYLLMCQRKSETPKLEEGDFEKQLIFIQKTLQEVGTVKELAKRESKVIGRMRPSRT
ncbi:coiled-coil domain-containing protein 42 [Tribolium castaneum]|uniref:Coiled-coil domain-containing protein 42A-like Protein n=1 Tax=Tribolium castaneum TaxID=7070 RepID=D6WII2_TRICA|nr:PREDICTED: coiled-coil domain-containing protein 42A [Tribolium castaneum]EFA01080.2 Coiled-coil domain-containing protein 42A-like Protein [Tribolium castaneum]|eukprot:XP_008191520.2 PREDICTED: coiled-coil domain-containing protein 42A [Tribolium castaneum]